MSETDEAAEMSVRDAIRTLNESGARAYSLNVPYAAEKILVARSNGALDYAEANERITRASIGMVRRRELEAPLDRDVDWKVLRE
jgi:hypothetical protein